MLRSLRFLRDRLDARYARAVDVLSDVLTVMRTGQARSAQVTWHAPWAQEFAPVPGAAGFHVVLSGPCWLIQAGADPLRLEVGDVVFRPHGQAHTLADSPSTRPTSPACRADQPGIPRFAADTVGDTSTAASVTLCGAYELDPGVVHPLLRDLPELVHLRAHLGQHPQLRATVDLLAGELLRPRLGTDALIPALLDTLLLHILRSCWSDPPHTRGWAAALDDPATSTALRAIHNDPARPWTVATLAAEARLSRAPFAARFTDLVGQPPIAYLTWWRLTSAARRLRATDEPVRMIASSVGYTSEFAFANAFKRRYGTAPGAYRRQHSL
jgi:AraC-like DNA-binding protein